MTEATAPSAPPLLGFYGDDFTGSIDALDRLARAGVRTVLFVRRPSLDDLARYPGVRAFGIAGRTRSMNPVDVEGTLRLAFESIAAAGVNVAHYAACEDTPVPIHLDKVAEVAADVFGPTPPVLIEPNAADERLRELLGGCLAGRDGTRFVIGPSRAESALAAAWQSGPVAPMPALGDAGPLVVACGSCTATTTQQIRHAVAAGYAEVILSPNALGVGEINTAMISVVAAVTHALDGGRNVVIHTDAAHHVQHTEAEDAKIGSTLGHVLRLTLQRRPVRRVAVIGNDTCGRAALSLGIHGLEVAGPMLAGAPLCRATAGKGVDGVQILFKNGQLGPVDLFECVRTGTPVD